MKDYLIIKNRYISIHTNPHIPRIKLVQPQEQEKYTIQKCHVSF